MTMKDILAMIVSEFQEFRSEFKEEVRELREVQQSILKFMGESSTDRLALHKVVDNHDKRITTLEQSKKKDRRLPIRFSGF